MLQSSGKGKECCKSQNERGLSEEVPRRYRPERGNRSQELKVSRKVRSRSARRRGLNGMGGSKITPFPRGKKEENHRGEAHN